MTQDKDIKARNRELVSRIYAGALNPGEYTDMFAAWDEHFQALSVNDVEDLSEDFDWAEEFVNHFEQAGKMIDHMIPQASLSMEDTIAQMPYAAFACSHLGKIQFANQNADFLSKGGLPPSIFDLPLDTGSEKSLQKLVKALAIDPGKKTSLIMRIYVGDDDEPHIFICETVEKDDFAGLLVKSISAIWTRDVEDALASAFELTQAEIDLVGNLYKGLSIKEIAEWKGRSPATLRTQLSAVLNKTGTKSQSALSRMIVSLVHMVVHANRQDTGANLHLIDTNNPHQRRRVIELSNGLMLEYVESGDLKGKPFYFLQTSSRNSLTKTIVAGLAKNGIRLISPVRPGRGRTTKTPPSFTAKDWALLHLEVIDKLGIGEFACGGHRAGGVYALELAKLAGARCQSVLLACTGAPIKNLKAVYDMHPGPRRLFLGARYFYKVIVTPMKYISVDFNSGPDGEARAVDYYCDGSPADQKAVKDPKTWTILRNNIGSALENIPQLASDMSRWAKDNTKLYLQVAKHSHIRFFHGAENLMMHPNNIIKFCDKHKNMSYNIAPHYGQLLIYMVQEQFVSEVNSACNRCS